YGDGSTASGNVYADKVVVGSVTATSQAVEAATSVSSSFLADVNNDGLVGLSFSNINTVSPNQQKTFFDTVKSSLALPLWTANLKKGAPGSYDFGYIDSSKYSGKITYVSVNSASGFWQFTADGYQVGSSSTVSSSFTAIADTGTSLMYLPSSSVTAYWAQVTGSGYDSNQGGYTFPCSSSLPDFNVVVGGNKFTVPGSYMNYAQISYTTCFGGLQQNTGLSFSILGDIFLKSQFMVFSEVGGQATLGFAAPYNGTTGDGDEWECED
ncbi:aspartyl protease, partial [Aureobasidium melanogenum]